MFKISKISFLYFFLFLLVFSACDYQPEETFALSGKISCNETGLSGVLVNLSTGGSLIASAQTDSNGEYLFDNMMDGTWNISPSKEGYTFSPSTREVILNNDVSNVDFTAQTVLETYRISGTITMNGAAVPAATVAATQGGTIISSILTDSSGGYVFDGIPAGTYTVTPSKEDHTFTPESETVAISAADIEGLDFVAAAVLPPAGEPIKIILVGDICLDRGVESAVEDNGGDYSFPFLYVGDYLRSADLTFGNLESVISDQGSNTKYYTSAIGTQVSFRADPAAVNGLTYAGFDVVSVANNHFGDWDYAAMTDSMDRIEANGISCVGGGNNYNEAHAPVIKEVNGVRIAFLAYSGVGMYADSVSYYSETHKWIAKANSAGLAWMSSDIFTTYGDVDDMRADIAAAKAIADTVIVSIHWGWEYYTEPNDAQIAQAHAAIDAGASLVVGHHPHVIQTIEEYNGCYIAYSLGNFIFDQSAEGTTRGMIVETLVENGAITSVDFKYSNYNDLSQAIME